MIKSISVFCGSSAGTKEIYTQQAFDLGKLFAMNNIRLIYGGASIGVMGAVANGSLSANGEVVGVIPHFLNKKEIAHTGITELITVETMHERKLLLHTMADAFIILPGGYGTLEEMFEAITWSQLGLHNKKIGILNLNGFYDQLILQIEKMITEGFIDQKYRVLIFECNSIEAVMDEMTCIKK
jgi:uncharacterized protein (TIGR00730 family)